MQIYFRASNNEREEYEICSQYFKTVPIRTKLDPDKGFVICRYSALPFNKELEDDLKVMGLTPINSSIQHSYIANMDWIYELEDLTFKTWFDSSHIPDIPLVVKGRTNSRKFEWNTRMFASNKKEAMSIMFELWKDPLIGPQGVVFRKYHKLKTFEIGVNGMPMTNEYRCFFLGEQLIASGFYWSSLDDLSKINDTAFNKHGLPLAKEAAKRIKDFCNFFVIDVAEDENGNWFVVEVNDGQMSGLSTIDAHSFYKTLLKETYAFANTTS